MGILAFSSHHNILILLFRQKGLAGCDEFYEVSEADTFFIQAFRDAINLRAVSDFHRAAGGVGEDFGGEIAGELVEVAEHDLFQTGDVAKRFAGGHAS